ncbi:MAG: hypothetical protein RMY29_004705 [Nostoc sp. CreGUA01]|nr:AAA family ATPase [Nostoc sp. CreGUA01]
MNSSTARKNPYIIGRPIYETEKFFGRESLFEFIKDNLNNNIKILLLHGQRRIGTSSVLKQFYHKLAQDKFVFVTFDLQGYSQSHLSDILHNLAQEITEKVSENLNLNSAIIPLPSEEELNKNPEIFSANFLPNVYHKLGDKNLVLLLDEFDVVSSDDSIINQGSSFFIYLQSLLKQQEKLFIIPVVGRTKNDLQNLLDLFKCPPSQEVSLLDEISAKRLITKPAQGMLEYEEDAIEAILELSSGHPYFIQANCFNIFLQAKIEDKWKVTRSDVEGIVDKTIESVTSGLAWFWDGLSIDEKVVFSAVAEAQKKSFIEDWLTLLKKYGVIQTEELIQAKKQLVDKDYLDDSDDIKCRVKIELVRLWIIESHPLQKTIRELEELRKQEINIINEEAIKLYDNGKIQDTIDCYENILKLNPNHFSTLPILADRYLEIDNFDNALKVYQRAYQIDYIRNKEGFLLALEAYGNNLIKQREFIKAKVQFEEVLKIEPDRESAKYKLREIEAEIEQQQKLDRKAQLSQAQIYQQKLEIESLNRKNHISQRVILGIIVVIISLVGIILLYRFSNSCDKGQQKVNGACVDNRN